MNIVHTSFKKEEILKYTKGSGIVPFSVAQDGQIYVLLGRERFVPLWRSSCRWSGFEGSRLQDETIEEAAAREFSEESLEMLMPYNEARDMLISKDYEARITLHAESPRSEKRLHCTHCIRVPYDPDLPLHFDTRRSQLEFIDRLAQELRYMKSDEFPNSLGHIEEVYDHTFGARTRAFDNMCGKWHDYEEPLSDRILAWNKLRNRLERALIVHSAITVVREGPEYSLQDVHVSKDYLEKDSVRWWTVEELHDVLNHHGSYLCERFRPYFLPVLKVLLDSVLNSVCVPPTELCESCPSDEEANDVQSAPNQPRLLHDRLTDA